MSRQRFDAVVFDLGGVVLPSPFDAWADYEREVGLDVGFIRGVVAATGANGAWGRHERGELTFEEFCEAFDHELHSAGGEALSAASVLARIGAAHEPRPRMIAAIADVRAAGLRTAALTNNWADPAPPSGGPAGPGESGVDVLGPLFDVVVESRVEGLRKPDPRIYLVTCERLGVDPARAVVLDDLGVNLKPARELGMATIKVIDPDAAIAELEDLLGLTLGRSL